MPNRAYGLALELADRPGPTALVISPPTENQNSHPSRSADQPTYGLNASGAEAAFQDERGTTKVTQPGALVPPPGIPAGAPITGATWTATGLEVFALRGGRIWCIQRLDGMEGDWTGWSELPYTGNRKPFTAIAAHSEPKAGKRNAVLAIIGTTPHVNEAKGLWGAMTRPGNGKLHDMRLVDVAIVVPQSYGLRTAFVVEAQGGVWEWSDLDWFSSAPWEEIKAEEETSSAITASAIAACSDGDRDPALFAIADGQVYHRTRGFWRILVPWKNMEISAAPVIDVACWSLGNHHVNIFALDADGKIWRNKTTDGMDTWGKWHPVNSPPCEARTIAATSRHNADGAYQRGEGILLAGTKDGTIYEGRHYPGTKHDPDWPTWTPLPTL